MRVILTGGGTGGHFYPIIAVADALKDITEEEKIAKLELIYMSDAPYDEDLLLQKNIKFKKISSGKIRRYFSFLNFTDMFKVGAGIFSSLIKVYSNFPDVVFSKGGYASFPVLVAARIFGIPTIIHDSDAVPGKVNLWAAKFAKRIAISFSEAARYFPEEKTALTGNPVRRELFIPAKIGAKEFLRLEENTPTIFVIGGSQGSQKINDTLIDILPSLIEKYQIIHQCGKKNLKDVEGRVSVVLEGNSYKSRYHLFDYLNLDALRMAYGAADLVISRASAGAIFEIAASGLPSILIPLANSAQNHQHENAYAYAKVGAANVIEETNLTPHILESEIANLINDKESLESMRRAAKKFSKPQAAEKIAREIINLTLEHA